MYFSKNSRYVLKKARFLSPSFLKGVEKNLSVKTPKDDPSKPPLRINIPDDTKTNSVGSSSKTGFEEGLLQNPEKEIQFSRFTVDDILVDSTLDTKRPPETVRLSTGNSVSSGCSENKHYNEGLRTVLHADATEEALGDNYFRSTAARESRKRSQGEQNAEKLNAAESVIDPKTLYIIIDVPDKKDEMRFSATNLVKDRNSSFFQDKNSLVRGLGQNLERKSKSLPRFSTFKPVTPNIVNNNLEVHEVDDSSTYVLQLKLSKAHRGVLCVPERDVTTRGHSNQDENSDVPVKVRIVTGSNHPLRKQVAVVEDRPEIIRYGGEGKAVKVCKSEDSRKGTIPGTQEEVGKPEGDGVGPRTTEEQTFINKRNGFNVFVRDDFGSIRTGVKTYPFKMPSKYGGRKSGDDSFDEDIIRPTRRQFEKEEITTNHWWKKDPLEESKVNIETDMPRVEGEVTSLRDIPEQNKPGKERNENTHGPPPPESPPPKKVPEESPYVNVSDVLYDGPITENSPVYRNLRDTMYDIQEFPYQLPKEVPINTPPKSKINNNKNKVENTSEYYNIDEVIPEGMKPIDRRSRNRQKKPKPQNKPKKLAQQMEIGKGDGESSNFHTSARTLTIGCENNSTGFVNFGSAFPPLLSEALKTRFKFRKEFLLSDKWKNVDVNFNRKQKRCSLEENSILFPEKESEDLNCDALFYNRDEIVANLIKNDTPKAPKTVETRGSETASATSTIDTLTVMKKVKEIVQFDLNNAVKLFNNDGGANDKKEQSSVVMLKDEGSWEVDKEDLARHIEMRKKEMRKEAAIRSPKNKIINGDGAAGQLRLPLYLPPESENTEEMKLEDDHQNSAVVFNTTTNEFFISKNALAKAISERTKETFEEVDYTLALLAEDNVMNAKSGDSILVFDVETQSWKVDFSILEKRRQQQQIEEELSKRSEAILETFERLEKEQFSSIPKPNSSEKRTFDYQKEEWKAYDTSKSKSSKSKCPFKKSNAEEIRKKNSDMFDNMFDGKKKSAMKNSTVSESTSDLQKHQKFCSSKPTDSSGSSGAQQGSGSPPNPPKPDSKPPTMSPPKEEDHFWESFLRIQIPPRASKELPPVKTPPPVAPPPTPPASPTIPRPAEQPSTALKVPKPDPPKKKIEEPRFRIHLPFIRDRKVDKKKQQDTTSKADQKATTPSIEKKEVPDPKVKAPSPPTPAPTKGDPPKGVPNPTPTTVGTPVKQASAGAASMPYTIKIVEPKLAGPKNDKAAAAYVSDKIIEISRNKNADHQAKIKTNKIETVKLNITSDTRMPSKITEINLNKNCEEKVKEPAAKLIPLSTGSTPSKAVLSPPQGNGKKLNKHLENFKTPFSDPDFEEKVMKIKPDLESNPNLKKLDNWSKTLVLHDIMKPPENLEMWLKDETDKMATLLLKVLQEAGDAKSKKKQSAAKAKDKLGKGNPQENLRKKKHEPEDFFFRVQTMNPALGNDKKLKSDSMKDFSARSEKASSSAKVRYSEKNAFPETESQVHLNREERRSKKIQAAATTKDLLGRFPLEITDDVPGPEILKKISNAWKVFPVVGSQMTIFAMLRLFQLVNLGTSLMGGAAPEKYRKRALSKLFDKYGPIVNVQGPLSGNIVLLHKPEHLNAVFEQDIPLRSVFDSLEHSRGRLEDRSTNAAICTEWNKPEWNDLRQGSNDPILKVWEMYFGCSNATADSLVHVIRKNRNAQDYVSEDFMNEIKRWSLEGLCNVLFEKSFGYLEGRVSSDSWIMEPEKLFLAMDEATNYLHKCERGFQAWRMVNMPSMNGLSNSYRTISSVITKQINQAEINLKNKGELIRNSTFMTKTDLTFIESMLLNDGLSLDEITCSLTDIMLIGTNIMNSAMGFLLYNLSQNTQAQRKLFAELKENLPSKNSYLDYNSLNSLKYLQACLKESLRLHIPVPIFYRLLQSDILVSNYIIPKGTFVVMDYGLSSMKDQLFEDPEKFIPERWLDNEKLVCNSHPFASFPFCQGPKAELIKRVVEMHLMAGAAKIIRNFGVEYQYGDIRGTDTLISFPDKPLKLNFIERDC